MTCAHLEIALCDYLDGTLAPAEKAEVERHLSACAACSALARDAGAAMAFMERVADVEPPPELVTRIYGIASLREARPSVRRGIQGWLRNLIHPMLQPRMVMGLSLTILFFGMMVRCAGVPDRRLSRADLDPAHVWAGLDDRAHRTWERTVKFYENLRFVYRIQAQLREWREQQDQPDTNAAPADNAEDHRAKPASQSDPGQPGAGSKPTK